MTQTLHPPTATGAGPARFIVNEEGKPIYALIDYELYLALQETIDDWYADQHAIATNERYLGGEEPARPWSEIETELRSQGFFDDDDL